MDFILSITVFGFFTQKKNPPKLVPKNYLSLYTNFCTNSKTCINKSIQKKKNSLLIQQLVSIYIACNAKYIDLTVTSKIKQIWNSILRSKVKRNKKLIQLIQFSPSSSHQQSKVTRHTVIYTLKEEVYVSSKAPWRRLGCDGDTGHDIGWVTLKI